MKNLYFQAWVDQRTTKEIHEAYKRLELPKVSPTARNTMIAALREHPMFRVYRGDLKPQRLGIYRDLNGVEHSCVLLRCHGADSTIRIARTTGRCYDKKVPTANIELDEENQ